MPSEMELLAQQMAEISRFMEEKYDPLLQNQTIMREETERLTASVSQVLEQQRKVNLRAILGREKDIPRVPDGKYRGMDEFDLQCSASVLGMVQGLVAQGRPVNIKPDEMEAWQHRLVEARNGILESAGRALDSTTVGAGDELVFTGESSEMWRDVHLMTSVASLFAQVAMPTNPFIFPFDFGDVNWFRGTPNIAGTSSTPATANRTLTANELVALISWSYNLDEDAVIAAMPELRALLVRNAAEVLDDIVLNGDTTDDGTNINADGAAASSMAGTAGQDHFLIHDGLVHIPIVDNTGQGNNLSGAVSDDMFNQIRSRLGRFGVRPSDMAFILDVNTFIRAQSVANFRTLDKMGPAATLLTGQLGAVEGIPVIVSEQLLLADTDGKVTAAGNGTDTGRLMIVNRTQYRLGFVRELLIESERDIQKRSTIMVASVRVAFEGRIANASDNAVALQFNITGVT